MNKYELLETDTIDVNGVTLKRVRALVAITAFSVLPGDLGGYIEKVENLDQTGNAWVFGDAHVFGDARVFGDACVSKNPLVITGLKYNIVITDENICMCDISHKLDSSEVVTGINFSSDKEINDFWLKSKGCVMNLIALR